MSVEIAPDLETYGAAYERWSAPARYYGFAPPINAHRRVGKTTKLYVAKANCQT